MGDAGVLLVSFSFMKKAGALPPIAILLGVFALSRLLYTTQSAGVGGLSASGGIAGQARAALSGAKLEVGTLERGMPLLDERLLREDLWRSLYYLHSQPPLFNLFVAGMLRSPDFPRVYQYANWTFGAALYVGTYALMRRLGAATAPALLLTIAFLLTPNALWMESAIYYGVPIALLLVLAAVCFERAASSGSLVWFAGLCLVLAILPLTRAFFTLGWCVLAAGFSVLVLLRAGPRAAPAPVRRRRILLLAAAPVLLVLGFQLKQFLLFRQFAGSSWLGCNLAAMTAGMREAKQRELERGRVSPLVNVYRNSSVEVYRPYFPVALTKVAALDEPRKSGGEPNFNNAVYLPVGRQYLKDTLYLISRYPHLYLANVVNSAYIFCGYQIGIYFDHPEQFFARWKWYEIAAPFLGFPLIAWGVWYGIHRWRRGDATRDPRLATIVFLTGNVIYVALVACLVEKSEGPLYRFQVDAFLWTLLALAITDRLSRGRRQPAAASDVRD
jgi:hypothetical protein